jgi:hypothetical protein
MAGRLDAPVGNLGKRLCYNCGNRYPSVFRFCPLDSVDLDYPQPVDSLARNFRRPNARLGAAFLIPLFTLALAAWIFMVSPINSAVTPAYGELTVRTTPTGARVYLDGSQVGVSPVRLSDIPTGVHEVRAVCPGYSDGKAHVEILPSATQKLVWDLSPLPTRKAQDRNRFLANLRTGRDNAAVSSILTES